MIDAAPRRGSERSTAGRATGWLTSITGPARGASVPRREAAALTVVLAALLVWLPLQTPVAMLVFQYGGLSAGATRGLLLAKDFAVMALLGLLVLRQARSWTWRWYDVLAVAYTLLLGLYSIVPWLLGSDLPFMAVAASARIFFIPVELYAVGRLAVAAGADVAMLFRVFLATAAAAAVFTVAIYLFLPVTFWSTALDLPRFIREVQGIPGARSLESISLLGNYGVGIGYTFPRAVGPFTHPVGTGHYFVMPLLLTVAGSFHSANTGARIRAWWFAAAALLFAAAVVAPISRGSWIAAGIGVLVCGIVFRRIRVALAALVVAGVFLAVVPPFSYSVSSALSLRDASVLAHGDAIDRGLEIVGRNPFGLGVGHADQYGWAFAGDAFTANVGENMYIALLVTVGPLGLLAFVGWFAGVIGALLPGLRPRGSAADDLDWVRLAVFATLVGAAVASLSASPLMRFTTSASVWLLAGAFLIPEAEQARLLRRLRGSLRGAQWPWAARRRGVGPAVDRAG